MQSLYIEVEFPSSLSLEWVEIFKERESKMLGKRREYCWLWTVIVNLILYQIFRNIKFACCSELGKHCYVLLLFLILLSLSYRL